jgi:heat shock protein HslJ
VVAAALLVTVAASCASSESTREGLLDPSGNSRDTEVPADLANTSWTLAALNGQAVLDGTIVTLEIQEDTVRGSAGCNDYRAEAFPAGGGLFSGIARTEMACSDPAGVMRQEDAYLSALRRVEGHRLGHDLL